MISTVCVFQEGMVCKGQAECPQPHSLWLLVEHQGSHPCLVPFLLHRRTGTCMPPVIGTSPLRCPQLSPTRWLRATFFLSIWVLSWPVRNMVVGYQEHIKSGLNRVEYSAGDSSTGVIPSINELHELHLIMASCRPKVGGMDAANLFKPLLNC